VEEIKEYLGYIGVVLMGSVWTIQTWVRRFSRDKVELAKDRAEVSVLSILRDDNAVLRAAILVADARANDSMRELGSLTARVELMTKMLEQADVTRGVIAKKIDDNTKLTKQAGVKADAAYLEANHVNQKIKNIGLQVADGTLLNPSEAGRSE